MEKQTSGSKVVEGASVQNMAESIVIVSNYDAGTYIIEMNNTSFRKQWGTTYQKLFFIASKLVITRWAVSISSLSYCCFHSYPQT